MTKRIADFRNQKTSHPTWCGEPSPHRPDVRPAISRMSGSEHASFIRPHMALTVWRVDLFESVRLEGIRCGIGAHPSGRLKPASRAASVSAAVSNPVADI